MRSRVNKHCRQCGECHPVGADCAISLRVRDAAHRRDPDAHLERAVPYGQRLSQGFDMLDGAGDDYEGDDE